MQADRDLLEAAALAAGIVGEYMSAAPRAIPQECVRHGIGNRYWNPIIDGSDAFRLAVKLRMKIRITDYGCAARIADGDAWSSCESHLHGGIEAATRRAIVRAAAALAPQAQGQQQGEAQP